MKRPKKNLRQPPRPMTAAQLVGLGVERHQVGNLEGAERYYREALARDPRCADALQLLGLVARRRGEHSAAADLIRQAIAIAPGIANYHVNLGLVLADAGEDRAGVAAFEAALALAPDLVAAHYNLGLLFDRLAGGEANTEDKARDLEAACAHYEKASVGPHAMAEAAFNVGVIRQGARDWEAAIAAYERALEIRPGYASAMSNLAQTLQQVGALDRARNLYEELCKLDPSDVEARHFRDALAGARRDSADATYVERFFDDYAARFEKALVEGLKYQTPALVAKLVTEHTPASGRFARVADLGCGTGLVGRALRDVSGYLVGVDLSTKMLDKAREAGGYDALEAGDIVKFLDQESEPFDLIVAADVLVYIGDLGPLLSAVRRRARPNGLFVSSTEHLEDSVDGDFKLMPTGRFAHVRGYVERVARAAGLSVVTVVSAPLREERGQPVAGDLYVLRA